MTILQKRNERKSRLIQNFYSKKTILSTSLHIQEGYGRTLSLPAVVAILMKRLTCSYICSSYPWTSLFVIPRNPVKESSQLHWCVWGTVMPIRQRGIGNPVCVGACCRHVHFRRCLCHVLRKSLVIKSGECVLDSVRMMVSDLPLRVTDAALRQSLLLSLDLILSLEREAVWPDTVRACQWWIIQNSAPVNESLYRDAVGVLTKSQ